MISFPSNLNIHLALEPQDLRKSFNGLAALTQASRRPLMMRTMGVRLKFRRGHPLRRSISSARPCGCTAATGRR